MVKDAVKWLVQEVLDFLTMHAKDARDIWHDTFRHEEEGVLYVYDQQEGSGSDVVVCFDCSIHRSGIRPCGKHSCESVLQDVHMG